MGFRSERVKPCMPQKQGGVRTRVPVEGRLGSGVWVWVGGLQRSVNLENVKTAGEIGHLCSFCTGVSVTRSIFGPEPGPREMILIPGGDKLNSMLLTQHCTSGLCPSVQIPRRSSEETLQDMDLLLKV